MATVRHRQHPVFALGRFNDRYKWFQEPDSLCREKGLALARLFAPGFGKTNQVIIETEYPDLATMEKEVQKLQSDPKIMKLFRKGTAHLQEGEIGWGEIEIEATSLALGDGASQRIRQSRKTKPPAADVGGRSLVYHLT